MECFGDDVPEFGNSTGGCFLQNGFELGEGHLDRIKVRAVGRQVEE